MLSFKTTIIAALSLSSVVFASPVAKRIPTVNARDDHEYKGKSLNGWGGYKSLEKFDDWYGGANNFDGHKNEVKVLEQEQVVCRALDARIVQQKLAILQEMAKRVLSEQVCEVETQTIILHQHNAAWENWVKDVHHWSGKPIGYDKEVAKKYKDIVKEDGWELEDKDHEFNGYDIGKNKVIPKGNNWGDDKSGRDKVDRAYGAAEESKEKQYKD
ncbi:hypothetical protein DL96DRAFT_1589392 [Flagelloscypha sp. PMI_526]|nr:hypothetical protein DL96DRAFT_1589392 [Flagelloscypha sp. PMI_526]